MRDKSQEQVEHAAASEAGRIRQRDEQIVCSIMDTPQGRHWMERLLDLCGVGQEMYLYDGDALGMAKRDGMAQIGRHLETQLQEFCPDQFVRMIRERRTRMEREREEQKKAEVANSPAMPRDGTFVDRMAQELDVQAQQPEARS